MCVLETKVIKSNNEVIQCKSGYMFEMVVSITYCGFKNITKKAKNSSNYVF